MPYGMRISALQLMITFATLILTIIMVCKK